MTALVFKDFSACWASWVACDSRCSGLDVLIWGDWFCFDVTGTRNCTWSNWRWQPLLWSSCSFVHSLVCVDSSLYTISFNVFLPSNSSPLRSLLVTNLWVTAAVILPLIRRPYEGFELNYLCPPKDGLGFTQTSNSYVPPT